MEEEPLKWKGPQSEYFEFLMLTKTIQMYSLAIHMIYIFDVRVLGGLVTTFT